VKPASDDRTGSTPVGLRGLLYGGLWRCSVLLQRAANACVYLSAGLLRRTELRRASELLWSEFNASDDAVDGGLEPWERRFYSQNLHPGDRVLMIGCGTGRDLIALRTQGFDVTGLDQSPAIIERARANLARRGLDAELIAAPIEVAELHGHYDTVILSDMCYTFILNSTVRIAALERVRAHLVPGGRVLLSYFSPPRRSTPGWWMVGASTRLSRADWRPELGDVFIRHDRSRRLLEFHHSFRPEEVARECAAAGFRVVSDCVEGTSTHCVVALAS
jgi:SAM-dependent methyltransferase